MKKVFIGMTLLALIILSTMVFAQTQTNAQQVSPTNVQAIQARTITKVTPSITTTPIQMSFVESIQYVLTPASAKPAFLREIAKKRKNEAQRLTVVAPTLTSIKKQKTDVAITALESSATDLEASATALEQNQPVVSTVVRNPIEALINAITNLFSSASIQ